MSSQGVNYVWRFGYGSNIGLKVLKQKKNLNPKEYYTGTIANYELYFTPGIPFVEPGWGATRYKEGSMLHGSAFCISQEEAQKLDAQEAGYNVLPCYFTSYCGKVIDNVGLYVPKKEFKSGDKEGMPSLRYLRLLQKGAREGNLEAHWIERLDKQPYYKTPLEVRSQTLKWIKEFESNPERSGVYWTAEELARHDGKDEKYPAHTSALEYVIKINDAWCFPSWKGHTITRRNLLQFRGQSLDTNDIRYGQEGFRPLPKLNESTEEEREFLLQNLESVLHRGGEIVARLKEFVEDQN